VGVKTTKAKNAVVQVHQFLAMILPPLAIQGRTIRTVTPSVGIASRTRIELPEAVASRLATNVPINDESAKARDNRSFANV
jgi:hypothetical protein